MNFIERAALRSYAMNQLKAYWPTIMSLAGGLVAFLMPSIQTYVSANPKTAVGVLLGCVIAAYHSTAPKDVALVKSQK